MFLYRANFCWITKSDFDLALTIGVSLVAVFTYAGLFGTFVPLVLYKYDIDPALATGPLLPQPMTSLDY